MKVKKIKIIILLISELLTGTLLEQNLAIFFEILINE
jgi:hypothetical protein